MCARKTLVLIVLCLISLITTAQLPAELDNGPVLFTVDKHPVSVEEFTYLYNKNHQHDASQYSAGKIEEYLTLFINFKLKVREAKGRGLDTTAAFRKEFNTYRDELRKPYLPDAAIVDSLALLTYQRMKEEVDASHILILVRDNATPAEESAAYEKIMGIRERILKGEDFGTVAQQVSEDRSAVQNKGNLGYFTAMQMVFPFENAAYSASKGEVTMPFRTRYGYHILKVNDRRPSSGEVEVSHILVRTGDNRDNARARNTIFDVYDQLRAGVSWEELCINYSEDNASKESGGKLRPFAYGGMASVPEFQKVAFELEKPGDFSDPFQSQFGWHIVRLERKIPLASFDELKASLRNRVSRDERIQISKQALYGRLREKYGFRMDPSVKKQVLQRADTTLTHGKWQPGATASDNQVLFSLAGKDIAVREFIRYAASNQKKNFLPPQTYLEQLLESFIENRLLEAVEEKVIAGTPEYKWLLKEYYEGILLFEIMEKEVWNKASEDSVGQRAFFAENASRYKADERIRGTIYSATTADHIARLKDALAKADSTEAVSVVSSLKIRHENGLFEKNDRIVLTKIPWEPGLYTTDNNNLFYLVVVKEIVPPGPKTFEEARAEVISDYQNHLEQNWIAALRKKYSVKVNKKEKELAFSRLLKEKTP